MGTQAARDEHFKDTARSRGIGTTGDATAGQSSESTGDDSEGASSRSTSSSRGGGGRRRKRASSGLESTGGAAAAESSDHRQQAKNPAKRKSTHRVRKEEKHMLLKEMAMLQERLKALELLRGPSKPSLADAKRDNALLRDSIRHQQLSLATAQCVVSGLLNGEHANPLSVTRIRLSRDWEERRQTLLDVKDRAIAHACEYVEARSRFLNPLKHHVSEERFENTRGDYCCARYDVRQFSNVSSVKQVYDALATYLVNIEITVSERLGEITTRDDFDSIGDSIAAFRFRTTEFGVPIVKHDVLFMQYFESHELSKGGPCGVFVVDTVAEDELYPYNPYESMRKDSSVTIALTPHWRPRADTSTGQELVVTMSIGRYIKLPRSECPLATPEVVEKLRENVMSWGNVMVAAMQESLYRSYPPRPI